MNDQSSLEILKEKLEEMLEEKINLDAKSNFYDVGGNSLLAMEFLNYLNNNFNVAINIKDLFEKSIFDIASMIAAN